MQKRKERKIVDPGNIYLEYNAYNLPARYTIKKNENPRVYEFQ